MKDLLEIEIEIIQKIIPARLFNKFKLLGFKTLGDILQLEIADFSLVKGVGEVRIRDLSIVQNDIKYNSAKYLDYYNHIIKIEELPFNRSNLDPVSLRHVENAISDFITLIDNKLYKKIAGMLFDQQGITLKEIGSVCDISRESARLYKKLFIADIGSLLQGKAFKDSQYLLYSPLVMLVEKLIRKLELLGIFTLKQLKFILETDFDYQLNEKTDSVIRLILESKGIAFERKGDFLSFDIEYFYSDISFRSDFIKATYETFKTLKYLARPLSEKNVIIEVKRYNENLKDKYIRIALNTFPEFEILKNKHQKFYQVRFNSLGNRQNRICWILNEHGKPMQPEEILKEINFKYTALKMPKFRRLLHLNLPADNRLIKAKYFWLLSEWNINADRIEDLVKKSLRMLNKPSTIHEISSPIIRENPHMKFNSIHALICRDCIKVEKDKYILPEWTNRYQNLSFVKKHKMRKRKSERVHLTLMRKLISEHLNNLEGKVDSAVNIVKLLIPQNSKFTIQAIYKMLRSDNHFYQFTKDRKILVRLVQPNDN